VCESGLAIKMLSGITSVGEIIGVVWYLLTRRLKGLFFGISKKVCTKGPPQGKSRGNCEKWKIGLIRRKDQKNESFYKDCKEYMYW